MSAKVDPKVIVALDFDNEDAAIRLVDGLQPQECRLKLGKEMFTRFGPELVKRFQTKGFDIFLDLKFHDIPNTVAKAVHAAADLGVWMVNVHTLGGPKMMEAAAKELEAFGSDRPLLTGVTVLTSMDQEQLKAVGITAPLNDQVLRLAALAKDCGLDGVVCSAREASMLRNTLKEPFKLVTPGRRPAGQLLNSERKPEVFKKDVFLWPTKLLSICASRPLPMPWLELVMSSAVASLTSGRCTK